VMMMVVGVIDC